MSDHTHSRDGRKEKVRVLKSYEVAGAGFAFPQMEQIAGGGLPPSRFESKLEAPSNPGRQPDGPEGLEAATQAEVASIQGQAAEAAAPMLPEEVARLLGAAREAEARAHALERRAAALLEEAEETGLLRLNEVEDRIDEMLALAAAAVEKIESEAREKGLLEGHEAGYLEGMEAGQAEGEAIIAHARTEAEAIRAQAEGSAAAIRAEVMQWRQQMLDAARDQVLDLALAVAAQILRAEVSTSPEAILPMVEAALSKMKGEEEPQLRVSPQVLNVLAEHRGRLLAAVPGIRKLAVEKDASLQAGDFVVQGSHGVVDGRLDQQVNLIARALREEG